MTNMGISLQLNTIELEHAGVDQGVGLLLVQVSFLIFELRISSFAFSFLPSTLILVSNPEECVWRPWWSPCTGSWWLTCSHRWRWGGRPCPGLGRRIWLQTCKNENFTNFEIFVISGCDSGRDQKLYISDKIVFQLYMAITFEPY